MSLFTTDYILAKLQEQCKSSVYALRQEDKEAFLTMIAKCYAHAAAINAKGEPFPNEAMLMSLVFSQYKMINWLVPKIAELSAKLDELEKEGRR